MLDAYIIEEIRKRDDERRRREEADRPRLRIEVPRRSPDRKPTEDLEVDLDDRHDDDEDDHDDEAGGFDDDGDDARTRYDRRAVVVNERASRRVRIVLDL